MKQLKDIRVLLSLTSLVVLLVIIWLQSDIFIKGTNALLDAQLDVSALAVLFSLLAVVPAAAVYQLLSPKKLRWQRTLLVQQASSFTGKLLPAGTGGMATMGRYLVTQKLSTVQATSIVSVNNLTSFIAINALTIGGVAASRQPLSKTLNMEISTTAFFIITGVIGILIVLAILPGKQSKLKKSAQEFWKTYLAAISHGWRFLAAITCASGITLCFVVCLYFSGQAFGISLSFLQALLVLTIGVAAAAVTPTPGGLGGAELGLMAALRAVGVGEEAALPTALLFRFTSYWLPMIPGFVALQIALKNKYL